MFSYVLKGHGEMKFQGLSGDASLLRKGVEKLLLLFCFHYWLFAVCNVRWRNDASLNNHEVFSSLQFIRLLPTVNLSSSASVFYFSSSQTSCSFHLFMVKATFYTRTYISKILRPSITLLQVLILTLMVSGCAIQYVICCHIIENFFNSNELFYISISNLFKGKRN